MIGGFHGKLLLSSKYSGFLEYERRFGKHLSYQLYCLEQWSNISAKDISRLHEIGASLAKYISRLSFFSPEESGKETSWSQTSEELEEMDASELQQRRKEVETSYSESKVKQLKFLEEISV